MHAVVARSAFRSKHVKNATCSDVVQMSFRVVGARDCAPVISEQDLGFCSISTNDGRRGAFEEDLQRCIFRGRRSTRDMFIRDVKRSGR